LKMNLSIFFGFLFLASLNCSCELQDFHLNLLIRKIRFTELLKIQSFSAVVGPNGSGKSNVIDAMLFVFGKRAKQVLDLLLCFLLVTELCLSNSYVYLVLDAAEQSFRANSQLN